MKICRIGTKLQTDGSERLLLLPPNHPALPQVLALIRTAFGYMDGLIDPPSSVRAVTMASLQGPGQEVWGIGDPLTACIILTPKPPALYLGKLAVAETQRGRGLARALIDHADSRARALGLTHLELQTRVELVGNQAAFTALGFVETGRTAHKGYDRPTSITYRRPLLPKETE